MGVNASGSGPRVDAARRVRLTDQALVAVTVARRRALAEGRGATVQDLLAGLVIEGDGLAGHLLRDRGRALALVDHPPVAGAPPLMPALAVAVEASAPRPPGTRDLLRAALEVGGAAVDGLLDAAAFAPADLRGRLGRLDGWDPAPDHGAAWRLLDRWDTTWSETSETVGLAAESTPDASLTADAAVAVARTRAVAGGAVELLLGLSAVTGAAHPAGLELADLCFAVEQQVRAGPAREDGWDLGLGAVERAAAVLSGEAPVGPAELVLAAVVAGGTGPAAVLDAAHALREHDR